MIKNTTICSLDENQKWPVWQFTVLWLLPWFFCSCLFVLMFYSGDKRRSWHEGLLQQRKKIKRRWKERQRGMSRAGAEKSCKLWKVWKKQPHQSSYLNSSTLRGVGAALGNMLWQNQCCGGGLSQTFLCVYHCQVTTRRRRKYIKSPVAGNGTSDPGFCCSQCVSPGWGCGVLRHQGAHVLHQPGNVCFKRKHPVTPLFSWHNPSPVECLQRSYDCWNHLFPHGTVISA